jgi:hypothetical protein
MTYTRVAAFLFAVVSFSHLLRILLGRQIMVDSISVPMWVSVLGVVIPGGLAVLIWKESGD